MREIRVLIVDDSYFMRKMITDLLQDCGIIKVVGTAKNGIEAVEKTRLLTPDVVTLDVEMPKMNGLQALEQIMKEHPLPIIMLSSLTSQGADTTIKALHLGAFDFIGKPSGAISFDIDKIKTELVDKILIAFTQKEKWINQWNYNNIKVEANTDLKYQIDGKSKLKGIVAIGTSTGGPKALQQVITNIPENFPYGILIVQHMPAGFTNSLAKRLNDLSKISVVEAKNEQSVEPGVAYIAPGNYHMTLDYKQNLYKISINQTNPIAGHRPSVDILFESLKEIRLNKVFVIMTGMGKDGSEGVSQAKGDKDIVIAEDESTCIVYGMPKAALNSGKVDVTAPLYEIPQKIFNAVENQRGWHLWK